MLLTKSGFRQKRWLKSTDWFCSSKKRSFMEMKRDALSLREEKRYARHLILPGFGHAGQLQLKAAKVLVVGAGGLGCPLLLYLAAAGVGCIGIIDPDRVSISNLQRQILYTEADVNRYKVEVAKERLEEINPHLQIDIYPNTLDRSNALKIFEAYDVIADGTDNFASRYLINDACVLSDKVNVHAAIFRFEGQVSVFNYLRTDNSRGPNYRDLFPEPPAAGSVPDCAEGGVLGVLAGIIGSLQAVEVIKVLTNVGEVLDGRLLLFDTASMESRNVKFRKRVDNHIKELIDYEQWCGTKLPSEVKEVEVEAYKKTKDQYYLLDVRRLEERALEHLGGTHIELDQLTSAIDQIPPQRPLLIYCQSGKRSVTAIHKLAEKGLDIELIYSLRGGLNAWKKGNGEL